jgi:26S proteasome regulatory subunit N2
MAYQISFDLEENATQEFLSKVSNELPVEPVVEEEKTDAMEEEKVKIEEFNSFHAFIFLMTFDVA